MPTKITIEVPKKQDFKKVNKIASQVQNIHVAWSPDRFKKVEEVISKELFNKLIKNEEILIAKKEEEIVGYVMIKIEERETPITKYRKQINIEAICVDEEHRGKGIGTKLIQAVEKIGKAQGCTNLCLTVHEKNKRAKKVYEKIGFKVKSIAYTMKL